jgi:hypothetical protein
VPRLVSSMPFRICLNLIEVAIDRRVPHSLGEGRGLVVDYSRGEEDVGGEHG